MDSLKKCTHCHKCRDNCDFLSKYGIDICDTQRLKELAFHCFLCGRCTQICPVGIDGRGIILSFRRESDEDKEGRYRSLLAEKRNYRYRNWKGSREGAVFFPGCNFPSLYPRTNKKLVKLFADNGIGTVYECCGKPVAEIGLKDDEDRIIAEIKEKLSERKITEIITACPNCRDFFSDRLGVQIVSVYAKLAELGAGKAINEDITLYIPCPDRRSKIWIEEFRAFINGRIYFNDSAQCCGLGGSAAVYEPDIADGFTDKLRRSADTHLYTYCASCMGRFYRCGFKSIDHILPLILGVDEQPDTRKSYINRVLTKIK